MHTPQTTLNQIHKKLTTEWATYLWDHLSNLYQDHPWKNFPTNPNTPPQPTPRLTTK